MCSGLGLYRRRDCLLEVYGNDILEIVMTAAMEGYE